VDRDVAVAAAGGKAERVVAAAVHPADAVVRPAAGVRPVVQDHCVRQLVTDQGLRAVHEVREQHLAAGRSRGDRPVVLVHDLDDRLLADVQADVIERPRCHHSHFGPEVPLDRRRPRRFDPRRGVLGQDLRRRQDDARRDRETSLELLLSEDGDDARIPADHLRLVRLQSRDHLVERRGDRDPRRPAPTRLHRRDHLLREMERAWRAETDDARLRRHPQSGERADEHGDPVRELRLRVEE
jgi:hypothetical protein